jgi:hypothetical protein
MHDEVFDKLVDGIKQVNIAHSIESVTRLDLATCMLCLPEHTDEAAQVYLLIADGQMVHPIVNEFYRKVRELR